MKLKLELPLLTDLNTYINRFNVNRYIANQIKQEETELIAFECKVQKLPALEKITKITFIWKHTSRRKDMDNVEFSQKFIWDGLVTGGILHSDGWKHRTHTTTHKHLVDSKNPGCTVLIEGTPYIDNN